MSDQIINTDSEAQYTEISSFPYCVNPFLFFVSPCFLKNKACSKVTVSFSCNCWEGSVANENAFVYF